MTHVRRGRPEALGANGALWKILTISMVFTYLVPATAVAKRGYFATEPSSDMQMQLRGSSGYGIALSADRGYVSLAVQGHHATVQYLARGAVGKRRITARFDSLGRVALRFHPRGNVYRRKEREPNCRGGDSLIQPGVFVGKLEFEGEQGYTKVHANRIKGTVTHTKRQVCRTSGREEGEEGLLSGLRGTILVASADEDGLSFNASRIESKSKPGRSGGAFSTTVVESPGPGFSVFRSIQATAKDSTAFSVVTSHGRVDEATVTPPRRSPAARPTGAPLPRNRKPGWARLPATFRAWES